MSYVVQIRIPDGEWISCDGSVLNVEGNQELFNILGYSYGGSDNVFKLPTMCSDDLIAESPSVASSPSDRMGRVAIYTSPNVPKRWKVCDGQSLKIDKYSELYEKIGNTHGGSENEFQLPQLEARLSYIDDEVMSIQSTEEFSEELTPIIFTALVAPEEEIPAISHIAQILPLKNKVISADKNTVFLAHYDMTANDVLKGMEPNSGAVYTLRSDGCFGGGIAVEEGVTNLMANKTMIVDTQYGVVGGEDERGTYFIQAGRQYTWAGIRVPSTAVLPGAKYTVSFDIMCDVAFNLTWDGNVSGGGYSGNDAGRTSLSTTASYTTPGQWQRVYLTAGVASDMTSPVAGDSFCPGASNVLDKKIYFRDAQIEQREFGTSFFNGTRANGILAYDMNKLKINPVGDWTISGWYRRSPGVSTSQWCGLFNMGNYYNLGQSEFQIWTNHNQGVPFKAWSHDNQVGRSKNLFTPNAGELDSWFFVAVTHTAATDTYAFYIWTKDRYLKDTWTVSHSNPITPVFYAAGSPHRFNGVMDELRIDGVVRTEAEITSWYYSNSPFWPKGIYRVGY